MSAGSAAAALELSLRGALARGAAAAAAAARERLVIRLALDACGAALLLAPALALARAAPVAPRHSGALATCLLGAALQAGSRPAQRARRL